MGGWISLLLEEYDWYTYVLLSLSLSQTCCVGDNGAHSFCTFFDICGCVVECAKFVGRFFFFFFVVRCCNGCSPPSWWEQPWNIGGKGASFDQHEVDRIKGRRSEGEGWGEEGYLWSLVYQHGSTFMMIYMPSSDPSCNSTSVYSEKLSVLAVWYWITLLHLGASHFLSPSYLFLSVCPSLFLFQSSHILRSLPASHTSCPTILLAPLGYQSVTSPIQPWKKKKSWDCMPPVLCKQRACTWSVNVYILEMVSEDIFECSSHVLRYSWNVLSN